MPCISSAVGTRKPVRLAFNSETPQASVLLCTLVLVTDSDSEVSAALPRTLDAEPSHRSITFRTWVSSACVGYKKTTEDARTYTGGGNFY